MRFRESDNELSELARQFENATDSIEELSGMEVALNLVDNFDDIEEFKSALAVISHTPAFFRKSNGVIYVNNATINNYTMPQQLAVLAHEVGHCYIYRNQLAPFNVNYADIPMHLPECIMADWYAIQWGFIEGLRSERMVSSGKDYVEIFNNQTDLPAYQSSMLSWYMKKNAGI